MSAAGQGDVRMEIKSPSGNVQNVDPLYRSGMYDGVFNPTEAGNLFITPQQNRGGVMFSLQFVCVSVSEE